MPTSRKLTHSLLLPVCQRTPSVKDHFEVRRDQEFQRVLMINRRAERCGNREPSGKTEKPNLGFSRMCPEAGALSL